MNYKAALIEYSLKMQNAGLTVATYGNISTCDRSAVLVYITPSGMNYDTVTEDDMVAVDLQERIVDGRRKPSVETPMHVAVYKQRRDVSAMIHAHPVYSTAFSSMGEDIPLINDEAVQVLIEVVRTTPYVLPGTPDIGAACVKALGERGRACLLRSHGSVCVGPTLADCMKVASVLEMIAHIYYLIRSMGGTYCPISEENREAMREFALTRYGQR